MTKAACVYDVGRYSRKVAIKHFLCGRK